MAIGAVLPAERDVVAMDGGDARVADGGTADVGPEIFDGTFAGTEGLEMHSPILVPHRRVDGGKIMPGCQLL